MSHSSWNYGHIRPHCAPANSSTRYQILKFTNIYIQFKFFFIYSFITNKLCVFGHLQVIMWVWWRAAQVHSCTQLDGRTFSWFQQAVASSQSVNHQTKPALLQTQDYLPGNYSYVEPMCNHYCKRNSEFQDKMWSKKDYFDKDFVKFVFWTPHVLLICNSGKG